MALRISPPSVADESFGKLAESMGRDRFREHVLLSGRQPLLGRLIEFVVTNRIERK